jgi:hypothetical protein
MTIDELTTDFDPFDYDIDGLLELIPTTDSEKATLLVSQLRSRRHLSAGSENEMERNIKALNEADNERLRELQQLIRNFVRASPEVAAGVRKIDENIIPKVGGEFDDDPNMYPNRPIPIIFRGHRIGSTVRQGDRVCFEITINDPRLRALENDVSGFWFQTAFDEEGKAIRIEVFDR